MKDIVKRKLQENVKFAGISEALVSGSETLTWSELKDKAEKYSHTIEHLFSHTDYVPIIIKNPFQFVVAVYSVWLCGKIPVPLNPSSGIEELKNIFLLLKSTKVISDLDAVERPSLDKIEIIVWNKLKESEDKRHSPRKGNETAVLIFTSGSTGYPKGVPISFSNLEANIKAISQKIRITDKETWLASLPFFHIGGFAFIWRAFSVGGKLLLPKYFSSREILDAVKVFKPSVFSVVSTTLIKLIDEVSPYKNIRAVFAGGGPVKGKLMKSAIEKGFPVFKVYGSTETGSMVTILSPDDFYEAPESAGKPFPGITLTINNPDNNGIGEICVKGKQITGGYLDTSQNYFTENGFFKTGDIGYFDKNGYLNIVGRKSEFIISGGENINLRKIKEALESIDEINDAEAFGVSDEKWGEKLVAVIVSESKIDMEKLKKLLLKKLSKFEIPKEIKTVRKIPHSPLGKPNNTELKKLFLP